MSGADHEYQRLVIRYLEADAAVLRFAQDLIDLPDADDREVTDAEYELCHLLQTKRLDALRAVVALDPGCPLARVLLAKASPS